MNAGTTMCPKCVLRGPAFVTDQPFSTAYRTASRMCFFGWLFILSHHILRASGTVIGRVFLMSDRLTLTFRALTELTLWTLTLTVEIGSSQRMRSTARTYGPRSRESEDPSCTFRFNFGLDELPVEPEIILIRGPRQYGKSTWLALALEAASDRVDENAVRAGRVEDRLPQARARIRSRQQHDCFGVRRTAVRPSGGDPVLPMGRRQGCAAAA